MNVSHAPQSANQWPSRTWETIKVHDIFDAVQVCVGKPLAIPAVDTVVMKDSAQDKIRKDLVLLFLYPVAEQLYEKTKNFNEIVKSKYPSACHSSFLTSMEIIKREHSSIRIS